MRVPCISGNGFSPLRVVIKRLAEPSPHEVPARWRMNEPEDATRFWREVIAQEPTFEPDKESIIIVHLNTRLRPSSFHCASTGTLSEALAHPREICRSAILAGAYRILLMHNHPSGDPSPSQADINVTKSIAAAADIIEIPLLDHVIVGNPTFYSFREAGLI